MNAIAPLAQAGGVVAFAFLVWLEQRAIKTTLREMRDYLIRRPSSRRRRRRKEKTS